MRNIFKIKFGSLRKTIITGVTVKQAEKPNAVQRSAADTVNIRALWDTGAGISLVSKSLAQKLSLISIDRTRISGVSGDMIVDAYTVDLQLTDKMLFPQVRVAEWRGGRNYDMLIGMDIISKGDFRIRNNSGKTVFSFKV